MSVDLNVDVCLIFERSHASTQSSVVQKLTMCFLMKTLIFLQQNYVCILKAQSFSLSSYYFQTTKYSQDV